MSEFKLKGLSSLDLKNGDKVEAEVEGIEGGKVLLVKVADQVHALNANCTHYGAPLRMGVLSSDGRLTCPWHGACFKVATGDVEDSPAPDHLHRFDVSEKNDGVYIKGQESDIKSGRRIPNLKCKAEGTDKVVVVGGGSGGFGTVQKLREHGFKGAITMISLEGYPPIDRTKLSKALIPDVNKVMWRDADFYKNADISIVPDTVTSIDFSKKSVSTKSGSSYPYTKLVLASGGIPKSLPLPGFKDMSNIFLLRTIPDVHRILGAVGGNKKKIIVVGSSFIGMEVANCLASKENNVTVVGMEAAPLEKVMGKEVGVIFQKNLEKNGVKFYLGASVDSATPSQSDSKSVGAVKLKDGKELEADLVIVGAGIAPATEYLKDNPKIKFEADSSLRTNENFAVEGLDDVYAIGDIATYPYHGPDGNGKPVRIEHWNVAQNMGRSVGARIAGDASATKPFIPVFWSALGGQLRYCGHRPNGSDDLIMKGEPDKGRFAAYYARGDTIVAVASMSMDPVMSKSAELMRRGMMPGKSDIEKGLDVLSIDI